MLQKQILNHAYQCGDNECCGFVIRIQQEKQYLPCQNIADNPQNSFEIAVDDWLAAENLGEIVALVHSHPNGLPILSEADQIIQQKTGLDWWIVCQKKIHQYRYIPPLLGRDFIHGKMDCYSLFRDAYHLAGINFPNFEREDGWWNNAQNLYLDNMAKHHFIQVDEQHIKPGDVILICLGSTTANHAAIYVGDQFILHHSPNRKSKRDLYNGFWQKYTHSIWRYQTWPSYGFMAISNNLAINSK